MKNFIRALWALSAIGFLSALFGVYGNLPQKVQLGYVDGWGEITRDTFFYSLAALGLISNGALLSLARTLYKLPAPLLFVPQKAFWTQDRYHLDGVRLILKGWAQSAASFANYVLILACMAIGASNQEDGTVDSVPTHYLILAGVLAISLLAPVWRLRQKKLNFLDNRSA